MSAEVRIPPSTPPAEDPKHIEAMIAKAEGRQPGEPAPADQNADPNARPEWLPSKFKSPEDLAAAYAELEKKLGQPQQQQQQQAPADKPNEPAADEVNKVVTDAGLDMAALEDKVMEKGSLDDADYEALAKVGITKDVVDAYIQGQQAMAEAMVSRLQAHVGGEQAFNALVEWAGQNLTAEEANAFNAVVDRGNEMELRLALDGLKAKFESNGGKAPQLLGGSKTGAAGDVYESIAQMTADMRDPRYSKDPAFRAKVEAKLARSSIL